MVRHPVGAATLPRLNEQDPEKDSSYATDITGPPPFLSCYHRIAEVTSTRWTVLLFIQIMTKEKGSKFWHLT